MPTCLPPPFVASPSRFRGTADIELLFCCVVLITLLMLTLGSLKIGVARLTTSQSASVEAFHNVTVGPTPQYTGDPNLPPIEGIATVRPGLPLRTHAPRMLSSLTLSTGDGNATTATAGASAGLISPAWSYNAYPFPAKDLPPTQQWFSDYVQESHPQDLTNSLGLAPAWPP